MSLYTTPATPAYTPTAAPTATPDASLAQINAIPQPNNVPRAITSNETVAGQMNGLLAQNSPYLQSAVANGTAFASGRGLVNSSIAAGAAEKAAIDASAPIAAQDASTSAAAGLSSQNADQSLNQTRYSGSVQAVGASQAANDQMGLQAQHQAATAQLQTSLKQMDVAVDMDKLDSSNRASFTSAVAPVMQQYQSAYENIQVQPDSVLNAGAKAKALSDLSALYKPQLTSMANIYSYPLTWPKTPGW